MSLTKVKKRILLVGLGDQMQRETIHAIKSCEDIFEVVGVCDIEEELIKKSQNLFPQAKSFKGYQEAIDSTKPDVVFISLPHYLHLDVVSYALSKGIKIFKEKPLALNIDQVNQLHSTIDVNQGLVVTLTKRPYYQKYKDAQELLPLLGTMYQYVANHYVTGGNLHYGWKSKKDKAGGGALINLGYHLLDILITYFGKIDESHMFSSSYGTDDYFYEVEDAGSLLIKHSNGMYGTFQFNCYTPFKDESLTIFGSKGVMYIKKSTLELYNEKGELVASKTYSDEGLNATIKAFRDFLINETKDNMSNLKHHTHIMKTISTLYQK